jgi:hypothetical protein
MHHLFIGMQVPGGIFQGEPKPWKERPLRFPYLLVPFCQSWRNTVSWLWSDYEFEVL